MADTDTEMKTEVRSFTQHSDMVLDPDDLNVVVNRARNHILARKGIEDSEFDFYASADREEALFWYSCLFSKVVTGELDAQTLQVGAIDIDTLLARDDDEVTTWYREAQTALRNMDTGTDAAYGVGITSVTREDREYGSGGTGDESTEVL